MSNVSNITGPAVADKGRIVMVKDSAPLACGFEYHHPSHTLKDILRPGYFNACREYGLAKWSEIRCILGNDPADCMVANLMVVQAPKEADRDIIVSLGDRKKYSIAGHDGTLGDEAPTKGKAA